MDSEVIETAAAQWVLRRQSAPWTEGNQEELDAWLAESTFHRIAYIRLDHVWREVGRLRAFGAGLPADVVPKPGSWNTGSSSIAPPVSNGNQPLARPLLRRWLAVAASVILPVLGGAYLMIVHVHAAEQYVTAVGEQRTVQLPDGSAVTLNTATRIQVRLGSEERRIDMASGEAYFVVAKDPSRPFVVKVGEKSLTAVGTQFSVRRSSADLAVLVTEGRVRLSALRPDRPGLPATLDAGTVARTTNSEVQIRPASESEVEQLLSWRSGFLIFHDTPLEDAVAEFNRYQRHKLVIADRSIATIRIGGKFRYANIDAFLALLQQGFPISVERDQEHVILTKRAPPT
jgi:transmembrane sensor